MELIPNHRILQTLSTRLTLQPSIVQQLPLPPADLDHPTPQFLILSAYLVYLLLLNKHIRDDLLALVTIDLVEVLLQTGVGFSLVVDCVDRQQAILMQLVVLLDLVDFHDLHGGGYSFIMITIFGCRKSQEQTGDRKDGEGWIV